MSRRLTCRGCGIVRSRYLTHCDVCGEPYDPAAADRLTTAQKHALGTMQSFERGGRTYYATGKRGTRAGLNAQLPVIEVAPSDGSARLWICPVSGVVWHE